MMLTLTMYTAVPALGAQHEIHPFETARLAMIFLQTDKTQRDLLSKRQDSA